MGKCHVTFYDDDLGGERIATYFGPSFQECLLRAGYVEKLAEVRHSTLVREHPPFTELSVQKELPTAPRKKRPCYSRHCELYLTEIFLGWKHNDIKLITALHMAGISQSIPSRRKALVAMDKSQKLKDGGWRMVNGTRGIFVRDLKQVTTSG